MNPVDIDNAARQFAISGEFISARPYGSGHINDTYIADYNDDGGQGRYIIQRINHSVFKDPESLMDNFVRVTSHIRQKLQDLKASCICRRVLTVIPARDGANYYKDEKSNYYYVEHMCGYVFCVKRVCWRLQD